MGGSHADNVVLRCSAGGAHLSNALQAVGFVMDTSDLARGGADQDLTLEMCFAPPCNTYSVARPCVEEGRSGLPAAVLANSDTLSDSDVKSEAALLLPGGAEVFSGNALARGGAEHDLTLDTVMHFAPLCATFSVARPVGAGSSPSFAQP